MIDISGKIGEKYPHYINFDQILEVEMVKRKGDKWEVLLTLPHKQVELVFNTEEQAKDYMTTFYRGG